jgi:hypothetical protein
MQGNSLAEVHCTIIKRLPIQVQLQVVLKVYANVRTSSYRPECRSQLFVMYPNFDILCGAEIDLNRLRGQDGDGQ